MIELNPEIRKVANVVGFALCDVSFRSHAEFARFDHDGRAMSVVGADVQAFVTAHFLKARPEIDLKIFHQMADVNRAVGVGQSTRGDDPAFLQVASDVK